MNAEARKALALAVIICAVVMQIAAPVSDGFMLASVALFFSALALAAG